MTIDCSAEPYDLSVPAKVILRDIKAALEKKSSAQKPVILMLGERHTNIAASMLPLAVMQALTDSNLSFSVSIEYPHNICDELIETGYGYTHSPPQETDLDAEEVLHGILGFRGVQYVTQTKAQFLLAKNLTPCFADAARGTMDSIDFSKSLTAHFATRAGIPSPEGKRMVFAADSNGMKLRNLMIVEQGLIHHKAERTSQVLLHCIGASHIAGKAGHASYNDSMSALYRMRGYEPLSYMMARNAQEDLPDNADLNGIRFIKGWEDMIKSSKRSPAERCELYRFNSASKGLFRCQDLTVQQSNESAERFRAYIKTKGYSR